MTVTTTEPTLLIGAEWQHADDHYNATDPATDAIADVADNAPREHSHEAKEARR